MKRILGLLFSLLLLLQTIDPSAYAAAEEVTSTIAEDSSTSTNTIIDSKTDRKDTNDSQQSASNIDNTTVNQDAYMELPFPVLPPEEEQKYIVRLNESNKQNFSKQSTPTELEDAVKLPLVDLYAAELTPSDVNDLIREGTVESVELDQPIELAASKVEEKDLQNQAQSIPWGLYSIGANLVKKISKGKQVKVAVLDTGISSHSDLNIKGGISFVDGESDYSDRQGHGTHMAGTISAVDDTYGIIGVAPDVDLYAVKVINAEGKGYTSSVIQAIDWAIDQHINIINISFTSVEYSEALEKAIQTAREKGILIFAAAGNSGNGSDNVRYPAKYPGVIGVGAVNTAHMRATFSATGEGVDLVAPGTNVLSTLNHNKYGVLSGTSSATAFASGAAALLWEHHPDWTADQVVEQLYQTATSLGESRQYGKGLINVAKALGIVDGSIAPLTDGEDPSLITMPIEEVVAPPKEGELELAAYAHTGNGQTITAGQAATVSLKLQGGSNGENVHPRITITVAPKDDPSNVLTQYTKVVQDPDLDVDIPFTWQTRSDTAPGTYIIKYAYRAFADGKYDDKFTINVLPASGGVQDTYEPNNTFFTAKVVQEGESYVSYIPTEDDVDYYKFTATATRQATIQLHSSRSAAYTITAYSGSQNTITSTQATSGNSGDIKLSVESGETYYLKIVGTDGYFGADAYTLSIDGYGAAPLASPTNLITVPGYTTIKLTWDMMPEATSYIVQVNGSTVATTEDNVFKVQGLNSLTPYTLGVAAVYPTGNSKFATTKDTTLISELIINVPQDSKLAAGAEQLFMFKPATTGIYHFYTGAYLNRGGQSFTDLKIFEDSAQSKLVAEGQDATGTSFSEIKTPLIGGKVYYVRLSGFDHLPMEARITAKVISSDIPYIALNDPKDIDESKNNSTVYIFVPGATASYKLLTSYYGGQSGAANNTHLQVYSDASLKQLVAKGEADDSSTTGFSKLDLSLDRGVPYYVKVSAYDKVYARLLVTTGPVNYAALQSRQLQDVSVKADQEAYFSFTPVQTGKYRFFTTSPGGTSRSVDPSIRLYNDSILTDLFGLNDDVEGKGKYYGSLNSKLETELQAGKTYYLAVANEAAGKPMNINVQVEDAFQSDKNTAQRLDWDDLYSQDAWGQPFHTSSLYDVDFYRVSLSSKKQININIFGGMGDIETKSGRIYGYFNTNGDSVFEVPAGEYYLRVDNTLAGAPRNNSVTNFVAYDYDLSMYINEFSIADIDENDPNIEEGFITAREDQEGDDSLFDLTPYKDGTRRKAKVFTFKNPKSKQYDTIAYEIYPVQFSGDMYRNYILYQQKSKNNANKEKVPLYWDGSVQAHLREYLAWVYNGRSYAKNGIYEVYIYPLIEGRYSKHKQMKTIKISNSVAFGTGSGRHYAAPPATLDGTSNSVLVTAGLADSCSACKAYFNKYVLTVADYKVEYYHDNYMKWFKENYGRTSLESFFDGMDKVIVPNPDATLSEEVHAILSAGEVIPIISVVAGGGNSILYLSEGEYTEASLSAAGMIPFVGTIKVSYRAVKVTGEVYTATKELKMIGLAKAEEVAKYAKKTCNCFVAGTQIQIENGEKPIEAIQIGDRVLSKNAETGQLDYKAVTALYRNEKDTTYKLHVGQQIVETTDNHPFWVEGKGWITAIDLKVGDQLKQSNGNILAIEQIEIVHHEHKVKVYNFTVADDHTYFVSDLGIWVHNIDCAFVDNQLFETSIISSSGIKIESAATVKIEGTTLILKDILIYPVGYSGNEAKNLVGTKELKKWSIHVAKMAKEQGFEKMEIKGFRAENSSSANPGKIIDITINLKR
ncbi:S8 family serine peptidase [Paenibacillus wenxiniae]|uniref:S8 family serine peptidase n=1 Tax=Paenibacillus wenxiniae TaxID=1636843 RepID=A0ABW4RJM6_9BACL